MIWKDKLIGFPSESELKIGMKFEFNGKIELCDYWDYDILKNEKYKPPHTLVKKTCENKFEFEDNHTVSWEFLKKHYTYLGTK